MFREIDITEVHTVSSWFTK